MEELKLLVGMVADLPALAIWVIIAYFVYKVIIVGSVYGVIKLGIRKLHDVLAKKKEPDIIIWQWSRRPEAPGMIDDAAGTLEVLLRRIRNKGSNTSSQYVHLGDVEWLREAINEKETREEKEHRDGK